MIPPLSPYNLIQESLWPSEWKSLVACLLLNRTTRKQVEKVIDELFAKWTTPESMASADENDVFAVVKLLGFGKIRSRRLIDMSSAYIERGWSHASELPGVGEYASRAWEIFFVGKLGDTEPKDGALASYWRWRKFLESRQSFASCVTTNSLTTSLSVKNDNCGPEDTTQEQMPTKFPALSKAPPPLFPIHTGAEI